MTPPNLGNMPMEITDYIAGCLETTQDLQKFALTCQAVYYVVISPKASCWRTIFEHHWDLPPGKARKAMKETHKKRTEFEWKEVIFGFGTNYAGPYMRPCDKEVKILNIARDLIVESYAGLTKPATRSMISNGSTKKVVLTPQSKNQKELQWLVQSTNLKDCNKHWTSNSPRPSQLVQAVWLVTLQWQLQDTSHRIRTFSPAQNFLRSQKAVYQHPGRNGIFRDRRYFEVNLSLAVSIANFFKFYLTERHGFQMYDRFQGLLKSAFKKPQPWRHQILQGSQQLGRNWIGCNAYLPSDKVAELRGANSGRVIIPDELDEEYGFAKLELDFDNAYELTKDYEDALESTPPVCLIEALKEYPTDWIKSAEDPNEFWTDVSDFDLKQRADDGDSEAEILLAWRRHSRVVQPSREGYATAKDNFFASWNNHSPSPHVSPGVPPPPSALIAGGPSNWGTPINKRKSRKSPPPPLFPKAALGVDYHPFSGTGQDGPRRFNCVGNVHAVLPVEGIPGWQRISMMKLYEGNPDLEYCFEGVVFPGNMMMVGRWWKRVDTLHRYQVGPFFYWRTD